MAGGLAVISDVPKTSSTSSRAGSTPINREPAANAKSSRPRRSRNRRSAELKPGQVDQDSLPPYDILDQILQLYVEENQSARDIVARGFEEKPCAGFSAASTLNEYKRAQAAPGIKVTSRAFGLGRRMPIAQRYADLEPLANEACSVKKSA